MENAFRIFPKIWSEKIGYLCSNQGITRCELTNSNRIEKCDKRCTKKREFVCD